MDYQSNSKKSKEAKEQKEERPPKVIERITTTEVIQKKKGVAIRFKEVFFGGTAKDAARYVVADVFLPALRNMVYDMGSEGLKRTLFGASRFEQRRPYNYQSHAQYGGSPLFRTHYEKPYATNLPDQPRRYPSDPRAINAPVERSDDVLLIIPNRAEAEKIVETLIDTIDKYDVASVQDLKIMAGLPLTNVDNKWGWTSLNRVEIRQVTGGYLIDMPSPEPI